MRPSINVLPPQLSPNPYLKKGSQSPASPSSTFSYNHRHSKKDITEPPPPAPQQHGSFLLLLEKVFVDLINIVN